MRSVERIKLGAAALNNVGVGALIAGIVAPSLNNALAGVGHIVLWVGFAFVMWIMAQALLGRLPPP